MTDTAAMKNRATTFTVSQNMQRVPEVKSGYATDFAPVRWLEYKPQAKRQMKREGRWQRMNEYAGWDNCEPPGEIWPDVPISAAEILALIERVETLEAENAELHEALGIFERAFVELQSWRKAYEGIRNNA